MDTVNSNDYMKIEWAESGTTEYEILKEQKYGNLIKKYNLIITLTLISSVKYDGTSDKEDTSPSFKIISKNNKLYKKENVFRDTCQK